MGEHAEVINWEEALQQVGDDEEFLKELLSDLRGEVESQLSNIASIIQNPVDQPYEQIRRAAHRVKGAAGNLMCGQLHSASHQLEQAAAAANAGATPEAILNVQASHATMQLAGSNFISYLRTIGV